MTLYEIGHKASYFEARSSSENYVFDRWMYTTIIRLNYDKGISIDETVNQILSYALTPDMVFILSTSPQTIIKRRILRDNDANIDTDFYVYENSVFKKLNNHQKFAIINNDRDITETTEEIVEILRTNKIIDENNVRRKIKWEFLVEQLFLKKIRYC